MQSANPHMERRVLDPNQRAVARRLNDTHIVTAGLGTIICASKSDAWDMAVRHNSVHGFEGPPEDRRAS